MVKETNMMETESDVSQDSKMKSQSEILAQRRKDAEKEKARNYWRLLRQSIRDTVHTMTEADNRNVELTHGIYHSRKLNHSEELQDVLLINNGQEYEYVTLDRLGTIRVFKCDGRKRYTVQAEESMNRLLFTSKHNMYVGYTHGEKVLYLMSPEFEILSSAKSLAPITLASYNASINEVITVGGGFFTAWRFRYNARYLLPRKVTQLTGYEEAEFTGLVLEPTASRSQQCFLCLDTGVVEYNVYDGHFVAHYKDLHNRTITALTFFNPLKYLVTAAKDGCIKVWDKALSIVMVFVAHTDAVNYLGVHPYGPAIMSGSLDCTIRVWSLESCDEIDKAEIQEPVQGLSSQLAFDTFITFCGSSADLWNIQHLYHMHTSVGYRVFVMKHTMHPMFPKRSVLLCKDSSVRLLSPNSGDIITTLLQPARKGLVDAAYAISEGTMFVVTGRGSIVKCKTNTNPCTVVAEWEYPSEEFCNYLLVYEYVVDAMLKEDVWGAMKKTVETRSLQDTTKANVQNRNRTLLLGGRKDGYICVFNWNTGKVDFSVDTGASVAEVAGMLGQALTQETLTKVVSAHGVKGVLSMIANSKEDQLISAGMDNIIKVWRLYPFAEEALAPLMSFYCGHTPSHMVMLKSALCVAFHDHSSATYSVVLYNLITNNRSDHPPADDHQDTITGLTACHKLRLFATSSLDGTVRVWSDNNQLLRVLRLGVSPHSIGFCNQRGDLLLGIGQHVSRIPHNVYLPKKYLLKMSCMKFLRTTAEPPIPLNENLLNQLNKSDLKRLKNAKASLKYDEYMDKLSSDEQEEVTREVRQREQAYATIEERENELRLLRDGGISCKKKPRCTAKTRREALKQFMKLYYNKPRIQLPADRIFQELQQEVVEKETGGWIPEKEPTGFFPPTSIQKTELEDGGTIPVGRGGFVPNSILLRLLWPNPPPVKVPEKRYQPPALNKQQLLQIDQGEKPTEDVRSVSSSTPQKKHDAFDSADGWFEEESVNREDEVEEGKPLPPANLLSKFEQVIKRSPSLKSENEEMVPMALPAEEEVIVKTVPPRTTLKAPSTDPPSETNKPTPLPKREPRPKRPVVKIVSQAAPLPAKPIAVLPERMPTPPSPPTPLPDFIMQFKGQEWFEKYFPNCNPETLPKPWTVDAFSSLLGHVLKIAGYTDKVDISAALMTLHSMEDMEDTSVIAKCFLSALNQQNPPTALVQEEKTFILTSLRALQTLKDTEQEVIVELMTQYIDGDKDIRATALNVLWRMGVTDPHGYLAQELDSWDTWNLEESNRKPALHNKCHDWLDRWMASFKIHLEDTIEKLKRGQNVHGRLGQRQAAGSRASTNRKRSPGEDSVVDTSPREERADYRFSKKDKMAPHYAMAVNLESVTDPSVLENATCIEAINYFCELTFEKEMEKLKRGPIPPISEEKSGQTKNTVLVLPKIQQKPALVRLGETHTSCCRPKRETSYNTDYRQIPPAGNLTSDFPSSINFPMKRLYLNPFPSPLDTLDMRFHEPVLITLKSSQKYFIPEQSYSTISLTNVNPIPAAR